MGNADAHARASVLFAGSITGKVNPIDSNVASGYASITLRLTASSGDSTTLCLVERSMAGSVSLKLT